MTIPWFRKRLAEVRTSPVFKVRKVVVPPMSGFQTRASNSAWWKVRWCSSGLRPDDYDVITWRLLCYCIAATRASRNRREATKAFRSCALCSTVTMPPRLVRPQNLNDAFLAAAECARQKLPAMSHNQKVSVKFGARSMTSFLTL